MESMPTCQLSGPAGVLEALFEQPSGVPRAAVVFAHPHPLHGGTMHTKVVYRAAKTFLELGCAVLRFNFRGVGDSDGEWDEGEEREKWFDYGLQKLRNNIYFPGFFIIFGERIN